MNVPQQSPPVVRHISKDEIAETNAVRHAKGVTAQECKCPSGTLVCRYGKDWVDTGIPC
jgi:hypothetical protein